MECTRSPEMMVYYNEIDPQKAAWLRELIQRGVVADGEVDTRSIKEVSAPDLAGFRQCHFFAGIGVWSYALRLAGWPNDRSVWTGSCPCPSFSAAGKGGGFNDPRHLWPDWARLIRVGKPATIFGEQADDAIGYGWLDLVQTDLERENYAVGKAVLGACSVGAPHIRQRLYFVAHSETAEAIARSGEISARAGTNHANGFGIGSDTHGMEHATQNGPEMWCELHRQRGRLQPSDGRDAGGMEHADSERRREARRPDSGGGQRGQCASGSMGNTGDQGLPERKCDRRIQQSEIFAPERKATELGSHVNGFWRDADWILRKRWNRDDWEWCPTEPGTFPLVAGAPARVLRLRGYGDAICAPLAAEFIKAFCEVGR